MDCGLLWRRAVSLNRSFYYEEPHTLDVSPDPIVFLYCLVTEKITLGLTVVIALSCAMFEWEGRNVIWRLFWQNCRMLL